MILVASSHYCWEVIGKVLPLKDQDKGQDMNFFDHYGDFDGNVDGWWFGMFMLMVLIGSQYFTILNAKKLLWLFLCFGRGWGSCCRNTNRMKWTLINCATHLISTNIYVYILYIEGERDQICLFLLFCRTQTGKLIPGRHSCNMFFFGR